MQKQSNIFNPQTQSELYILMEHLLLEHDVKSIKTFFAHGTPGVGGDYPEMFINDPKTLFLCNKMFFNRSDALSQMIVNYEDSDTNDFFLVANLVQPNRYESTLRHAYTILKYFVSHTNVQLFEFIGWKITLN